MVGLGLLSMRLAQPGESGSVSATDARPSVPARPAGAERLIVRNVYDGDTLQLQAAKSGRIVTTTAKIRVRLIGIDAPEMRPEPDCFGPEATDRLRALAGPGTAVWVATDQESPDRYGRPLFLIWTEDGRLVNYELVAEGYAEAIRVRPNVTYWPLLRARRRQEAREGAARRGPVPAAC